MAVSDRAWKHIEANPKAPFASVLSLKDWKNAWSKEKPFPFTPSVAEINGLDGALDQYLEEGPENVWRRHALTARACRAGIKAMGLELWAKTESIASPTCTAVRVPAGVNDDEIIAAARAQFGVVFSSGRNDTKGKLIRIGHMGPVAEPIYATVALTALGGALRKLGRKVDVAAGIEAALQVIAGLSLPIKGESMRRFEGRVAVVSGAAQGMGRAVAERLGQEGAMVVAVDINGDGADATAKAIGGKSFGIACDIGDEDAVAKLFAGRRLQVRQARRAGEQRRDRAVREVGRARPSRNGAASCASTSTACI